MRNPRLVKAACPQCGAGIKIDVQAQMVTCQYCRVSSFIHVPNRPDPPMPQGGQGFGHIHVPSSALKAVGLFAALMVIIPIAIVGIVVIVIIGVVLFAMPSRTTMHGPVVITTPGRTPLGVSTASEDDSTEAAGEDACAKAVACCKAVMSATGTAGANARTCEAMRALSDADCAKQAKTLQRSAKSLGKDCD